MAPDGYCVACFKDEKLVNVYDKHLLCSFHIGCCMNIECRSRKTTPTVTGWVCQIHLDLENQHTPIWNPEIVSRYFSSNATKPQRIPRHLFFNQRKTFLMGSLSQNSKVYNFLKNKYLDVNILKKIFDFLMSTEDSHFS